MCTRTLVSRCPRPLPGLLLDRKPRELIVSRCGCTRTAIDDDSLFVYNVDFTDGFYQFKCEALGSLFGLFAATIDTVHDDEEARHVPSQKGEYSSITSSDYGMVLGPILSPRRHLDCHEDGAPAVLSPSCPYRRRAVSSIFPTKRLQPWLSTWTMEISSRSPVSQVTGFSQLLSRSLKGLCLGEVVASQNFQFLGMVLDGTSGRLRHTVCRCWRLWCALTEVLQMRRVTGDASACLEDTSSTTSLSSRPRSVLEGSSHCHHSTLDAWACMLNHSLLIEPRAARARSGKQCSAPMRRRVGTHISSCLLVRGREENSVERWRLRDVMLPVHCGAPLPGEHKE